MDRFPLHLAGEITEFPPISERFVPFFSTSEFVTTKLAQTCPPPSVRCFRLLPKRALCVVAPLLSFVSRRRGGRTTKRTTSSASLDGWARPQPPSQAESSSLSKQSHSALFRFRWGNAIQLYPRRKRLYSCDEDTLTFLWLVLTVAPKEVFFWRFDLLPNSILRIFRQIVVCGKLFFYFVAGHNSSLFSRPKEYRRPTATPAPAAGRSLSTLCSRTVGFGWTSGSHHPTVPFLTFHNCGSDHLIHTPLRCSQLARQLFNPRRVWESLSDRKKNPWGLLTSHFKLFIIFISYKVPSSLGPSASKIFFNYPI